MEPEERHLCCYYDSVLKRSLTNFPSNINSFVLNARFLCPMKTPENRKGVEKGCIGDERVKQI